MPALAQTASGEPVTIGVSGPLTGQNAQYGAQWKKGFDLALDEVNAKTASRAGRCNMCSRTARPIRARSVAIAQKFVSDPKIVVEVGDFSSTASMAASPIYQRAGLVQFGFTNSHPEFHQGRRLHVEQFGQPGRRAAAARQICRRPRLQAARGALSQHRLGPQPARTIFTEAAKADGAEVVASEGYQPDEKDFRSTLVRVRDAKPDAIVLISYYADGALITRQIAHGRADDSRSSPAARSIRRSSSSSPATRPTASSPNRNFFPGDTRPEVQAFVTKFKAKYNEEPDDFNAVAYDTIILLAAVIDKYGPDRTAIRDGLAQIKDVPSVIYGKATFDPQTRRVAGARAVYLVVKDGQFVAVGRQEAERRPDRAVAIRRATTGMRRPGRRRCGAIRRSTDCGA